MPKISGQSLAEHRELVQRRVLDAMVRLLTDRSFESITMADLAAEAGIGRTAIYNHFRDRDEVMVRLATLETSTYLSRLSETLATSDDPREQFRLYVQFHISQQGEQHFGFGPELYAQLSPESLISIREHVIEVEAALRQILRDGVAAGAFEIPDEPAAIAIIHASLRPQHLDADSVANFLLRGLGA